MKNGSPWTILESTTRINRLGIDMRAVRVQLKTPNINLELKHFQLKCSNKFLVKSIANYMSDPFMLMKKLKEQ